MAYNAEKIEVLKGLEPVRKRPGMYIGNTGRSGLNHLVQEIIDNAVDEHLAGFCTAIDVVINEDGSATAGESPHCIPCKNMLQLRVDIRMRHMPEDGIAFGL